MNTGESYSSLADENSAATFVIHHDTGAAAVNRYDQAVALVTKAGLAYTGVTGDVQEDVDQLARVTNSVMPRFFLGDPTSDGWTSYTKVNNGGLRQLKNKGAELSAD